MIWFEWMQQFSALSGRVMDSLLMRQSLTSADLEGGAVVLLCRVVCVVAGRR
jgi:hypothetical protein